MARLRWLPVAAAVGLTVTGCLGPAALNPADQAASTFSLPGLVSARDRVALTNYAGQPLIINFFAAWSPPCVSETHLLSHFYRFYHRPVAIVGVDSRDDRAAALTLLQQALVSYPVASDPTQAVASSFGVPGIPTTFFLNARHQIVMTDYGWLDWKKLRVGVAAIDPGSPAAWPTSSPAA